MGYRLPRFITIFAGNKDLLMLPKDHTSDQKTTDLAATSLFQKNEQTRRGVHAIDCHEADGPC